MNTRNCFQHCGLVPVLLLTGAPPGVIFWCHAGLLSSDPGPRSVHPPPCPQLTPPYHTLLSYERVDWRPPDAVFISINGFYKNRSIYLQNRSICLRLGLVTSLKFNHRCLRRVAKLIRPVSWWDFNWLLLGRLDQRRSKCWRRSIHQPQPRRNQSLVSRPLTSSATNTLKVYTTCH